MARISRRGWWLILAAAVATGLAGYAYLLLRDEPPPADGDLRPARRVVAEEANGFFCLREAEAPVTEETEEPVDEAAEVQAELEDSLHREDLQPASAAFDRHLATQVLARNADRLQEFADSLSRPDFQVPELLNLWASTRYASRWRHPVNLVLCRSRVRQEEGRDLEALEDAIQVIRFGRRLEVAQGTMMDHVIGVGIQEQGVRQLLYLMSRTRTRPEELKRLNADLAPLLPAPEAFQDAYRRDYAMLSRSIDRARGVDELMFTFKRAWSRLTFKRNQTKRLLAEAIRRLIAESSKPAAEREKNFALRYPGRLELAFSSGRLFVITVLQGYDHDSRRRDLVCLQLYAARVMLALKGHVLERGNLPESLAELVPAYLDAVPLDPFDGKPLRYSRAKRIIYSVGPDLIDAGGTLKAAADEERPPPAKVKVKVMRKKQREAEDPEPTFPIEFG